MSTGVHPRKTKGVENGLGSITIDTTVQMMILLMILEVGILRGQETTEKGLLGRSIGEGIRSIGENGMITRWMLHTSRKRDQGLLKSVCR